MQPRPLSGVVILSTLLLAAPHATQAQAKPRGSPAGFALLARPLANITVNNVECGVDAFGEMCIDGSGYDRIGGGFWPKNSPQQYVFASGTQVAGTIDVATGGPWAGDTTGAFFFDPKGTTQHGEGVESVWNYADPAQRAAWPAAALVPAGDPAAALFTPAAQGRPSASEGDVWTLTWEGDTTQLAGRRHPLGLAMETRVLGWNYPAGNGDILYVINTYYNISSVCAADYGAIRPALQSELLALGTKFHLLNNAKFGITLPACGYTIRDLWVGLSYDADVSSGGGGTNYSSVDLPLALGYTYQVNFRGPDNGYQLPWALGGAPFINGYGFVGMKFLKTPQVGGQDPGIHVFSNTVGGGLFGDPQNAAQLYRYLAAKWSVALGDGVCNYTPATEHLCYIKSDGPADMRSFQSTGPVDLPPGGSVSVVTAYVFASAVATAGCPSAGCLTVPPGDPRHLSDAAYLAASGANAIDSLAGFEGYVDDNSDGKVQGSEFRAVRGSLMQKAQLAQLIFDQHFLLPSAPEAPPFFLIPGDNAVSVLWRPSATETTGDPFFALASGAGSPAYDPNFRSFDVQGYRIYRGRVDNPSAMTLLAQFEYAGADAQGHDLTFRDYLGAVDPANGCAPELGLRLKTDGCPIDFDAPPPIGVPYIAHHDVNVEFFVQVKLGDRFTRSDGSVFIATADTAVTGGGSPYPPLGFTGVPFVYVDRTAKNNLKYFYTVTAFDVNSIQSGPSSLESARVTKGVTPVHAASNYTSTGGVSAVVHVGRGVNMDSVIPADPILDSAKGTFSGPARPATGASAGVPRDFISQVIGSSGSIAVTLIGMTPGSDYDGIPATYTLVAGIDTVTVSMLQNPDNTATSAYGAFDALALDPTLAARYGGGAGYRLQGQYALTVQGTYLNGSFGRGCANGAGHAFGGCGYDGARWFAGANETFADPTRGNNPNGLTPALGTNFTNAGSLPNVTNVFEPRAYQTRPNVYRNVEGVLATISTAADYRVFWGGTPGTVDSVIDVTHNVVVPFDTTLKRGYTWGFLTTAATGAAGSGDARPGVLTVADLGCVAPIHTFPAPDAHLGCAAGTHYEFVSTATLGPMAIGNNVSSDSVTAPRPNPGFGMYLAGHFFLFELPGALPSATTWTMRSYVGAIDGGGSGCGACTAGTFGNYRFTPAASPLTAVGAGLEARYTASNVVAAPTVAALERVHTVPDPYYVSNGFETDPAHKVIKFVNLPDKAVIRIYTTSGILVRVIEHNSGTLGGTEDWDIRSRNGRLVANGVYFYAVEAGDARRVGRMTIVTLGR